MPFPLGTSSSTAKPLSLGTRLFCCEASPTWNLALPQQATLTWDKALLLPSLSHLRLGSSTASLSRLGQCSSIAKPLPLRTRLFYYKPLRKRLHWNLPLTNILYS
ncbi:hypothetical protein Adt_43917 [Abeliophyllum distichum]|uniref:Uncharacterized protein n=1 Tax=Abeliophyllum distichum TaxID=126358 RepID=A0ABD1P9F7_9LAMI